MIPPPNNPPEDAPDIVANDRYRDAASPTGEPLPEMSPAALWTIFADISQSLQVSSAAIKAAVSSLLDTSIIWDRSAQHEFMQNIDHSIDRVSSLMAVMTLAMKAESGQLAFVLEPSSVQEIIARAVDSLGKEHADTTFRLALSAAGIAALVDYDYLRIALKLLLEALLTADRKPPAAIVIQAEETKTNEWHIRLAGDFGDGGQDLIAWLASPLTRRMPPARRLQPEVILKAFTAFRLLQQQDISLLIAEADEQHPPTLTLTIPPAGEKWT
jgi:hypothetical protein